MKNKRIFYSLLLLPFLGCTKESLLKSQQKQPVKMQAVGFSRYVDYTIRKGEQYCNNNTLVLAEYEALSFNVLFNSSAIYANVAPENQFDINKLYGFADNQAHHQQYSARFGWRWSENALHLFAYVYNAGVRSFAPLGTVRLNTPAKCKLAVSGNQYLFTLNGKTTTMPRLAKTKLALGYKLYPYFGGDEAAPHDIHIRIEELK